MDKRIPGGAGRSLPWRPLGLALGAVAVVAGAGIAWSWRRARIRAVETSPTRTRPLVPPVAPDDTRRTEPQAAPVPGPEAVAPAPPAAAPAVAPAPSAGLFGHLGHAVSGHPWVFLVAWLLIAGLAGFGTFVGFGQGGLFDRMTNSQSLVSGSESDHVTKLMAPADQGESITIVVTGVDLATGMSQATGIMSSQRLALASVSGVSHIVDPFALLGAPGPASAQAQAMLSANRDGFLIQVSLDPALDKAGRDAAHSRLDTAMANLRTALSAQFPDAGVASISSRAIGDAIIGQVQSDLLTGEAISLPVALILLIIVFGGVVAAGLPLAGAIVSIVIGLGAVWGLTFWLNVDSFILNIITIIGLALSVDYGLLIVSRYREELAATLLSAGFPTDGSVVPDKATSRALVRTAAQRAIATAGRTVTFSAVTIACAMSALLTMTSDLLRTIAVAGIAVTLLAVLMAVMVVPALIVIANRVLIRPSVLTRIPGVRVVTRAVGDAASDHGIFSRLARRVHAHPWIFMAIVLVILGVMASPIRSFTMRTVFADYLPAGNATTLAYETLQADYPAARAASLIVVADTPPADAAPLLMKLQGLPEADFVSPPAPLPGDPSRSFINVHLAYDNQVGSEVTDQVSTVRGWDLGYDLMVGGPAALQKDFIDSVLASAPQALAVMAAAVLVLLFLMTGSLIVPVKALVINSLSLVASLGTTSWIFTNGHFGMPQTAGIETIIAACAVSFGFGLAMDYEVFLLARIKEAWDAGLPNDRAVELGLQRSGRIITSAAAIIVAVFIGFTFGKMIAIKEIGVVLAVTVITDATLVRLLLVPSTMTILGKWNWWAPRPLKRLYTHLGFLH